MKGDTVRVENKEYHTKCLRKMLTFLWEFIYNIIILKSLTVHHLCEHWNHPKVVSDEDMPKEISKSFKSPAGDSKNRMVNMSKLFEIIL